MQEKEYLEVYHSKCLKCGFLVEGAKERYERCHVTSGNSDCPASEIQIVSSGKVRRTARLILEARAARDPVEEARILKAVSNESEAFKYLLYQRIN